MIPDLRRVFEYHGAEHMAIHAFEHGDELTPAARPDYSKTRTCAAAPRSCSS